MTVSVMLFLLVVSAVGSLAALVAEAGLRRLGVATRWAWLAAMGLGGALLALPALPDAASQVVVGDPRIVGLLDLPGAMVQAPSWWSAFAWLPAAAWIVASLGMVAVLVRAHRTLARERGRWERRRVLEREVYVSPDRGPAVAGIVRPWIVLPGWALALDEAELTLVLLHEDEHARAGDCALLAAALAILALTAWNPVVWWQLRRLRAAVELDCDRRVLAQAPDPARYGASLIAVAARARGPSLGLAAFTERGVSLKRRITAMTETRTRRTALVGATLLVLAALVGVQACSVDRPMSDPVAADEASEGVGVGNIEVPDQPSFTPMTVRPEIVNREEIQEAMARQYPPLLRDAGIGGTVIVYFYIGPDGKALNTRISKSSGHQALDEAALRTAGTYRFSPALNGEEKVAVWIQLPIMFKPN